MQEKGTERRQKETRKRPERDQKWTRKRYSTAGTQTQNSTQKKITRQAKEAKARQTLQTLLEGEIRDREAERAQALELKHQRKAPWKP
jgi:hypothetical protein